MNETPLHEQDVALVERCLCGMEAEINALRKNHAGVLRRWLLEAGASPSEADELIETLWTDCLVGSDGRTARLLKYRGDCAVGFWLKAVAVNAFMDHRRRGNRLEKLHESQSPDVMEMPKLTEQPLTELMKRALGEALCRCSAEALVMLQLSYLGGLKQKELARMWSCTEPKVSRVLEQAMRKIEDRTMRTIKQSDPWLVLTWRDFLELCDGAGSLLYL